MSDREKRLEAIRNIINGKNQEKSPFDGGMLDFRHQIQNMDWNELRKLATSVNISVNTKRRRDVEKALYGVYVEKNRKGNKRT